MKYFAFIVLLSFHVAAHAQSSIDYDDTLRIGGMWSTVLGFHVAATHPELLQGLLVVCPVINQEPSEKILPPVR